MTNRVASILVAALVTTSAGCSIWKVDSPRSASFDCTQSKAWPVVDAAIAVVGLAGIATNGTMVEQPASLSAPAVFAAAAAWGNYKVNRCRQLYRETPPEQIAAYFELKAQRQREHEAAEAARMAAAPAPSDDGGWGIGSIVTAGIGLGLQSYNGGQPVEYSHHEESYAHRIHFDCNGHTLVDESFTSRASCQAFIAEHTYECQDVILPLRC